MAVKVTIDGIHAGYGTVSVLRRVSIEVHDGEIIALLGTNGNGKSTLMKCVMGLVRPSRGSVSIEIDGDRLDASQLSTEEIIDRGVSMVPEGRALFASMTVQENLILGAYRRGARSALKESLDWVFHVFPVLSERRTQLAGSMSGGEQQMLALARAIMTKPRLLLIDEPSVGLAPILVRHVIDKIMELKQRGRLTVLMAEQNFTETMRIADRGYLIVHGEIALCGPSHELNNSELVQRVYLGGGTPPIVSGER